jgi:hypothetical protein
MMLTSVLILQQLHCSIVGFQKRAISHFKKPNVTVTVVSTNQTTWVYFMKKKKKDEKKNFTLHLY